MENTKSYFRKTMLRAGIVVGLAGWGVITYGYFATERESVKETEEVKPVVLKQDSKGSKLNIESSIETFLTSWMVGNDKAIKTMILDNFDSVNGYFAYPVKVKKVDSLVSMDLGLSKVEVPQQNINVYKGFTETSAKLKKDLIGLAIVKYDNNNITSVEIRQLSYEFGEIQDAVLNSNLAYEKDKVKEPKSKEKTYKTTTADDWKGMTLLASREISSKDMPPIFVVPNTSLSSKAGDFSGSFYYIIAGRLEQTSETSSTLKSYEGKTIKLDFGIPSEKAKEHLNKPVWIHVITQNGNIKNIELQSFEGADMKAMAEGMMAFISTNAIIHTEQ